MSQITTHILDTALGKPADGVAVKLSQEVADSWQLLATGVTNADGRVSDLLPQDRALPAGVYKLHFDTASYFTRDTRPAFYPWIEVVFTLNDERAHYHVPLLLSPFGYSTYRGS